MKMINKNYGKKELKNLTVDQLIKIILEQEQKIDEMKNYLIDLAIIS